MLLTEAHAHLDYLQSIKSQSCSGRLWCYEENTEADCWDEPVPILCWQANPDDPVIGGKRLVRANPAMLQATQGQLAAHIGKSARELPQFGQCPAERDQRVTGPEPDRGHPV